LLAGRTSLLPPSRTPETLAQLAMRYPDTLYLGDEAGHIAWNRASSSATEWQSGMDSSVWPPPAIAREHVAAVAFTSGSTGEPQAQPKTWGCIVDGARSEIIALQLDQAPIDDVVLIGTVSPQHMYGFESTVLLALHGPCAFAAEHPLHPDEVVAVLSQATGRRVLITAPVHLRALAGTVHRCPRLTASSAPPRRWRLSWPSGANGCGVRACLRSTVAPRPAWWRRGARSMVQCGPRCAT
jgi:acyl-coenzyme A synthetase/AMP-(fatty) acid ligase